MNFDVEKSLDVLRRTPLVLQTLLCDIDPAWSLNTEGENTFSPFDVVGHLLHGEKTDWIPRLEIILSKNVDKTFTPYDRFAQTKASKGKTLNELLHEFSEIRKQNIEIVRSKGLTESDYQKIGRHPDFGVVTLAQLLSTWTVHDLSHIAQITRVMGKHYLNDVGPWIDYLPMLTRN